ncbi:MAG: MBL fold metallo-hydrolase [Halieaceae bacterium]
MFFKRSTAVIALIGLCLGAIYVVSDELQREVRLFLAGALGDVAIERMQQQSADNESGPMAAADMITLPIEVTEPALGIYMASGVGNTFVVRSGEGDVIFDTGLIIQAAEQYEVLHEALGNIQPTAVVLSHSHADHVGGARMWASPQTELVTSSEFLEEQRYLTQLNPYLHRRNRVLFPWLPEEPRVLPGMNFRGLIPDVEVKKGEPRRFTQGGRVFELWSLPGAEGSDNLLLWLPQEKILLSGDFFGPQFPQFPNIFTMRGEKVRRPIEYIESLNTVIGFAPELILPSHLGPIEGAERIMADLTRIRDAVQWVHDQTVAGMNAGKTLSEVMADVRLPEYLALSQRHGKVSWAVKSIWEYYATWFHFDRTSELYGTPQTAVLEDLSRAIDDETITKIIDEAIQRNEWERALHLLELLEGNQALTDALKDRWVAVITALRERSLSTEKNDYELYWLDSRLRSLTQ